MIAQGERARDAGDHVHAIQVLQTVLDERRHDAHESDGLTDLAEIAFTDGHLELAIETLAPVSHQTIDDPSSRRRALTLAAILNCAAGQVAPGQIDYCKSIVLDRCGGFTGAASVLNLGTDLTAATCLATSPLPRRVSLAWWMERDCRSCRRHGP